MMSAFSSLNFFSKNFRHFLNPGSAIPGRVLNYLLLKKSNFANRKGYTSGKLKEKILLRKRNLFGFLTRKQKATDKTGKPMVCDREELLTNL